MERLPSEYHSVIAQALQCYTSEKDMVIEKENAEFFAKKLLQMIKADDVPVMKQLDLIREKKLNYDLTTRQMKEKKERRILLLFA